MAIAVSQLELANYLAQALAQVCQKDDVKQLRNMLREMFGKQLQDLIANKTASREQYNIESPQLKEAIRSRLPVACAKNGSLQCMKVLQQRLPDVLDLDQKDSEGNPCLHLAITGHHVQMALLLIDSGVDVNAVDRQGRSALHWAVVCQIPELLSRLAIRKVELNTQDLAGASALHYAAQMCGNREVDMYVSLDCLQHLLCLRPNAGIKDLKGRTPLHWAATAGSPDACKLLVTAGAPVDALDETGSTALHAAVRKGSTLAVAALVRDCSAQTELRDGDGRTPAALALTCGTTDCLIRLAKLGASEILDDRRKSVAHVAAASGDLELVRKLQAAGFQFWGRTLRGELPVHFAVIAKHNDVVCHLLRDELHGNPRGSVMKTCLHLAVRMGNTVLIDLLLGMGADINSVLQYKGRYMSPLDVATEKSLDDCLAYVLQCSGQSALVVVERAARVVQRTLRRVAAIRKRKELLAEAAARQALQQRSARILQRALRRVVAARRLAALRRERELARRRELEERSARILQRALRCLVAARRLEILRREREQVRRRELEERSARVLQRALRRFVWVRKLRRLAAAWQAEQERRALMDRSARIVQRAMRQLIAVKCLQRLREAKRRNDAAVVVQRTMRRLRALLRLPRARLWLDEQRRRRTEERSAALLQRVFRRFAAVRRLRALFMEREAERQRRRDLLARSALIVQRTLRRLVAVRRARSVADQLRAEQRSRPIIARGLLRLAIIRRMQPERYQKWVEDRRERAAALRMKAAVVIWRALQRFAALRKLRTLRAERLRRKEEDVEAKRQSGALLLQRCWRKLLLARRMAAAAPHAAAEEKQPTEANDQLTAASEQRETMRPLEEVTEKDYTNKEELHRKQPELGPDGDEQTDVEAERREDPHPQQQEEKAEVEAARREDPHPQQAEEKAVVEAARREDQEPQQQEEHVTAESTEKMLNDETANDEPPKRDVEPAPAQAGLMSHSGQPASLRLPSLDGRVLPPPQQQHEQSSGEQTAQAASDREPLPPQPLMEAANSGARPHSPANERGRLDNERVPPPAEEQPPAPSQEMAHRDEPAPHPVADQPIAERFPAGLPAPSQEETHRDEPAPLPATEQPAADQPPSDNEPAMSPLPPPMSFATSEQQVAAEKTQEYSDNGALRKDEVNGEGDGQVCEPQSVVAAAIAADAVAEASAAEAAELKHLSLDATSSGCAGIAMADDGDEVHYYTDEYDEVESLDATDDRAEAALAESLGSGADFAEAAEAVRQHNSVAPDDEEMAAPRSRSSTPASQRYERDCYSDFEEPNGLEPTAAIAPAAAIGRRRPAADRDSEQVMSTIEGSKRLSRRGLAKAEQTLQTAGAVTRRRNADGATGSTVAPGTSDGLKSRMPPAVMTSKPARSQQATAPPAARPQHQPHAPRTPRSGQRRKRRRQPNEVRSMGSGATPARPTDSGAESAASLPLRLRDAVSDDADSGVHEEAGATEDRGEAAAAAASSRFVRRARATGDAAGGGGGTFFAPRPPASKSGAGGSGSSSSGSSSNEEEQHARRRRRRRRARKLLPAAAAVQKDVLPLPDAFRYYASVAGGAGYHRWSALDYLSRPVSHSLRFKVQLSVRQHEVYKAIAKGYNTTHTKTIASIPSFPIISPVKYLTAAELR